MVGLLGSAACRTYKAGRQKQEPTQETIKGTRKGEERCSLLLYIRRFGERWSSLVLPAGGCLAYVLPLCCDMS